MAVKNYNFSFINDCKINNYLRSGSSGRGGSNYFILLTLRVYSGKAAVTASRCDIDPGSMSFSDSGVEVAAAIASALSVADAAAAIVELIL